VNGTTAARASSHVEPVSACDTARHDIREVVCGANDGIITTFAVVAGVAGGGVPLSAVLIIQALPMQEAQPLRHGAATFVALVAAGSVPLVPYTIPPLPLDRFACSIILTMLGLFTVGALRSMISA